jgi:hypothetical protein
MKYEIHNIKFYTVYCVHSKNRLSLFSDVRLLYTDST